MTPSLRAPSYQRRVVDDELDELLTGAAAIALEGPKGVGKSATAAERVDTEFRIELPEVRTLLDADPTQVLTSGRVLLDEWQHLPSTWDQVRRAVDAGAPPGTFLLTGSASPTDQGRHSGAGRILKLRMRPLALSERGHEPQVSLAELLTGRRAPLNGTTSADLHTYTEEILASGLPGIRTLAPRIRRAQLDSYIERVIDRDVTELGARVRNPAALRRWLTAYAAATATTTSYTKIAEAASPGGTPHPARSTSVAYRDALERLFLLDPVPGWLPTGSALREVATAPKHHLADPALVAALLGVDADGLLAGDRPIGAPASPEPFLGVLFESLVTLSVRVYAQACEARVAHFRTHRGEHEVDLIIERHDGRIVAVEVKLARTITDIDTRHLLWLQARLGPRLLDAVVITAGHSAYRRPDGVGVIPAALLGP